MKQYNIVSKQRQKKRDSKERIVDFHPIYHNFNDKEAKEQASRCVQCPIDTFKHIMINPSYCRMGCPLNNKIPQWLKKTYEGDIEGAFTLSHEMSPFPEILGRVCPKKGLCESNCVIEKSEYSGVSIGEIETYFNEKAFEEGIIPNYGQDKIKKHKVAIVGSGPASLSCATFLLQEGIGVEIFEKEDRCGGLLTYGIPNFKLPKDAVKRRLDWMKEAGLIIHTNTEVGKDIFINELEKDFDCIFLGIGAPEGRSAMMDNEYANGVYHVMEILTKAQKRIFNHDFENSILKNKNVVVIGGGDSAMDALRTAIRVKAKSVKCIYRRDKQSMPCSEREVSNALEEGVEFIFNQAPKKVLVNEDMNVTGIKVAQTESMIEKETGKRKLIVHEEKLLDIKTDIIILALGFSNKIFDFYNDLNLKLGRYNDIVVNEKQETSHKHIYAGGDVVRGADLVVTAALDGRTAAYAIKEKLASKVLV
ncbi:glutamate synthase subunit beta [Sulfurospirillum arcachonense]|uniref:glutamate synthase subunit beta n=1 Tax=Sulfurospirillum arcachonense TaxID=57666 RepID=UPI00046A0B7B|nr:glutamate synthase subunit beta [Sulfurospirillum arcachonense]